MSCLGRPPCPSPCWACSARASNGARPNFRSASTLRDPESIRPSDVQGLQVEGEMQDVTAEDLLLPVQKKKRPRREASARAFALATTRQPSPFDLSGDEHVPSPTPSDGDDDDHDNDDDEEEDDDAEAVHRSKRKRMTGKQSKEGKTSRRISHSLIERRRREKINDCLGSLNPITSHPLMLQADRARTYRGTASQSAAVQGASRAERGESERAQPETRRQARPAQARDFAGNDSDFVHAGEKLIRGMAKQGTLEYIVDLERQLAQATSVPQAKVRHYETPLTALPYGAPNTSLSRRTVDKVRPSVAGAKDGLAAAEDFAVRALLTISTSPELRPVL